MAVIFNNDRPWGVGLFDFNTPRQGTVPDQFGTIANAGGATFDWFLNSQTGQRVFPALPANRMLIQTADDMTVRVAGTNLTRDGAGELLGGTINTLWFNDGATPADAFVFGLAANAAGYRAASSTVSLADDLAFVQGLLGGNDLASLSGFSDNFDAAAGADVVFANAGNDRVLLGNGNDAAVAGTGNDTVQGGNGNDLLIGNAGLDILRGGGGADTIEGGTGADALFGDGGADVFVFRGADGRDTLVGFEVGLDKIKVVNGAASFANVTVTQQGADTWLGIGNTVVILRGIDADLIDASSFVFGPDTSYATLNNRITNTDFVL